MGFFEDQSIKPAYGGARLAGNRPVAAEATFSCRWVRIFSMTTGASITVDHFDDADAFTARFSGNGVDRRNEILVLRGGGLPN
jgi:hypothetical protein